MGWVIKPKRSDEGKVLPNRARDYTFRLEHKETEVVIRGLRVTRQLDAVIAPRSGNLGQFQVVSLPPKLQDWILTEFKAMKEKGQLLDDPWG